MDTCSSQRALRAIPEPYRNVLISTQFTVTVFGVISNTFPSCTERGKGPKLRTGNNIKSETMQLKRPHKPQVLHWCWLVREAKTLLEKLKPAGWASMSGLCWPWFILWFLFSLDVLNVRANETRHAFKLQTITYISGFTRYFSRDCKWPLSP